MEVIDVIDAISEWLSDQYGQTVNVHKYGNDMYSISLPHNLSLMITVKNNTINIGNESLDFTSVNFFRELQQVVDQKLYVFFNG